MVLLAYLNKDMFTSTDPLSIIFAVWFLASVVLTYGMYAKAAMTDPGTIRTQIYLNQNTEESANIVDRRKRHARKPTTVLQE